MTHFFSRGILTLILKRVKLKIEGVLCAKKRFLCGLRLKNAKNGFILAAVKINGI